MSDFDTVMRYYAQLGGILPLVDVTDTVLALREDHKALKYTVDESQEVIESYKQRAEAAEALLLRWCQHNETPEVANSEAFIDLYNETRKHLDG